MVETDLLDRFEYHPPRTPERVAQHETARAAVKDLALRLNALLPDGPEKELAIVRLEEALMWANAAIAREKLPA